MREATWAVFILSCFDCVGDEAPREQRCNGRMVGHIYTHHEDHDIVCHDVRLILINASHNYPLKDII
jgi:hypothetical protein